MPKRIRLFGKKRGDRRSGPRWVGAAGETAFYAALMVCGGLAFAYLLAGYLLPEWWAHRNFVATTCTVQDTRTRWQEIEGERRYRPEIKIEYLTEGQIRGPTWTYDARMEYRYDRDEAANLVKQFESGGQYSCWYNPINPAYVVVARSVSFWSWLLLLVPTAVSGFAGYRFLRTVITATYSQERLAHGGDASSADPKRRRLGTGGSLSSRFPAVPTFEDIVNSPGTHLAYRLPSDASSSWRTSGLVGMAGFFGVVLVVLFSSSIGFSGTDARRAGDVTLLITLTGVECGLLWFAVREWLYQASRGRTRLEIATHPLFPGERQQLFLVQSGKLHARRLEVQILCQEQASYSPGTETRITRETVYRDVLLRRDFLEIRPGAEYEVACDLEIPAGAMHSFVAEHNRVDWLVLVRVRSASGGFERRFPICVYPPVAVSELESSRASSLLKP